MGLVPFSEEGGHRLSPCTPQARPGEDRTRKRVLTRTQLDRHPDLGLPAPRTVRNSCLLFKLPVCGVLLEPLILRE